MLDKIVNVFKYAMMVLGTVVFLSASGLASLMLLNAIMLAA